MGLIDEHTKEHLKKDFEKRLKGEVKIIFISGNACQYCKEIREIVKTIEELSEGKIKVEEYDFDSNKEIVEKYNVEMYPALIMLSETKPKGNVKFYGIPSGYEFISLIEDIFMLSSGETSLTEDTKNQISKINVPIKIQVFVTPTCPYCPRAVLTAHQLAMENENIEADMIEATEFGDLSMKYNVMAVPKIVINEGKVTFEGALPEPYFVEKVMEVLK